MVNVCDAIMGSGKSSCIISHMNSNPFDKYIYITPYLEEAKRIKDSCPALDFIEPKSGIKEFGGSKAGHAAALISQGKNISSTHQAFITYTDAMLENISKMKYTLIIDENIEMLRKLGISDDDLDAMEELGLIKIVGGMIFRTDRKYNGDVFKRQLDLIQKINIYSYAGTGAMFWLLPPKLITSFEQVYVLTYLFEGQSICQYMKLNNIEYRKIGVENINGKYVFCDYPGKPPDYVKELKDRIHICMDDRLNEIGQRKNALSATQYKNGKVDLRKLKGNLRSFFRRVHADKPAKQRMWTTFKGSDIGKARTDYVKEIADRGYMRSWVSYNIRATNKYRDKTVLAYLVNVYMNLPDKQFYISRGLKVDENVYSLSVLIQWIWRSAIRDGKEIYIYIPSRRMRELLINWLNSFDEGGSVNEAKNM